MRLKITINTNDRIIPFEYHGFIQAALYKALDLETAEFYHNQGYGDESRKYKMFVFSELKGKYEVKDGGLCFKDYPSFYISSVDSSFLNQIYLYYYEQKAIVLGRFTFDIVEIEPVEDLVYNDNEEYIIQTISPVCCYKTDEKRYVTYFHPKSQDFEMSIRDNLERKLKILGMDTSQEFFEILEVIREKKVRVKFKRMVIQSYNVRMKIRVSNEYLKMMMHTGMGARNSGGFGMIQIIK